MNPGTWGLIISGVLALGTVLGTILSRIGKKGDQELQSITDQFGRMLSENKYLGEQLTAERAGRAQDRVESEGRWSRQIDRCRKITDSASRTINRLLSNEPGTGPDIEGAQTLRAIDEHNGLDHTDN